MRAWLRQGAAALTVLILHAAVLVLSSKGEPAKPDGHGQSDPDGDADGGQHAGAEGNSDPDANAADQGRFVV